MLKDVFHRHFFAMGSVCFHWLFMEIYVSIKDV